MTPELPRTPGPLPPVYVVAAALAEWALHAWLPIVQWLAWPWRWVGLLFVLKGLILAALGRWQFRRHKTSATPFTKSDVLVTGGVFEWTRNPMYSGLLLALTGEALLFGSVGPWLVMPVIWLVFTQLFIRKEEAGMKLQFGQEYEEYCQRVNRWGVGK